MAEGKKRQPSIVATLRALRPERRLTRIEALRVAELQAAKLLALSDVHCPPVPEAVVGTLPRFRVERHNPLPLSGYTNWVKGRWLIVLNGAEPITRQRFSLLHETKHALDHPFRTYAYRRLDGQTQSDWIEQLSDYFAASVLMPKAWVKAVYCHDGVQELGRLARRFGVSQAAMRIRLLQLGLTDPAPRCRYQRQSGLGGDVEGALQPAAAAA